MIQLRLEKNWELPDGKIVIGMDPAKNKYQMLTIDPRGSPGATGCSLFAQEDCSPSRISW